MTWRSNAVNCQRLTTDDLLQVTFHLIRFSGRGDASGKEAQKIQINLLPALIFRETFSEISTKLLISFEILFPDGPPLLFHAFDPLPILRAALRTKRALKALPCCSSANERETQSAPEVSISEAHCSTTAFTRSASRCWSAAAIPFRLNSARPSPNSFSSPSATPSGRLN